MLVAACPLLAIVVLATLGKDMALEMVIIAVLVSTLVNRSRVKTIQIRFCGVCSR